MIYYTDYPIIFLRHSDPGLKGSNPVSSEVKTMRLQLPVHFIKAQTRIFHNHNRQFSNTFNKFRSYWVSFFSWNFNSIQYYHDQILL